MPKFRITAPDGKQFDVEGPEGSTAEQALAQVQASYKPPAAAPDATVDPTGSFGQNLAAGAGKAIVDLGRGAGQILRTGIDALTPTKLSDLVVGKKRTLSDAIGLPTEADIAAARELDKPLMDTAGGMVGNVAGNVAASLLVPGAGTYKGATAAGAALGALQPAVEGESRLTNTAVGGAAGAAGKAVGDKIAGAVSGALANRTARQAAVQAQNAPRDAVLAAVQAEGAKVAPRMVQKQGVAGSVIEAFGGRTKIEQQLSNENQAVWNKMARKTLGMADDTPITPELLQAIRKQAGDAYEALRGFGTITADRQFGTDLAKITQKFEGAAKDFPDLAKNEIGEIVASINKPSFSADAAIDAISILRERAASAFAKGDKSLGTAYRQTSQAMEDAIERNLLQRGSTEAVSAFQAARRLIAKTYSVEKALDTAGNVSAPKLAGQLAKGKPLSDELKTIAEFAGNPSFAKAAQNAGKVEPYSVTDAFAGSMLGVAGGLPAAAIPLLRPAARSVVMSPTYQRLMAQPEYGTSALLRGAASGSRILPRLLPGGGASAALGYAE